MESQPTEETKQEPDKAPAGPEIKNTDSTQNNIHVPKKKILFERFKIAHFALFISVVSASVSIFTCNDAKKKFNLLNYPSVDVIDLNFVQQKEYTNYDTFQHFGYTPSVTTKDGKFQVLNYLIARMNGKDLSPKQKFYTIPEIKQATINIVGKNQGNINLDVGCIYEVLINFKNTGKGTVRNLTVKGEMKNKSTKEWGKTVIQAGPMIPILTNDFPQQAQMSYIAEFPTPVIDSLQVRLEFNYYFDSKQLQNVYIFHYSERDNLFILDSSTSNDL
jgi:hypothetical protein